MPRTTTLATKVPVDVADAVRALCDDYDMTVSDLLREYVEAVAEGRRWQLVDDDDELVGWVFRRTDV